jgi:hypothetical protein
MTKSSQLSRDIARIVGQRPLFSRSHSGGHELTWHWIGTDGDPWPEWLRAYKSACGVYAIKESGKAVYVGSSRKRLYDTVTRHFQQWKRKKNWWKGLHGAHHDPGIVYQRKKCQIAVYTAACGDETSEEARLIDRLKPRDNLVEHPDGEEEVPF